MAVLRIKKRLQCGEINRIIKCMTDTLPHISPFMPLVPREFLSERPLSGVYANFLNTCEFFSSGRSSLLRALEAQKSEGTLWLPEYFCPAIKKMLAKKYAVAYFTDIPSEAAPRFKTIKAKKGDIVLAVNFFGLRSREDWDSWREAHKGVVVIEDHSHAPFSDWAMSSCADWSFASLRKYLPLPDGAYLYNSSAPRAKIYSTFGDAANFCADALSAAAMCRADYSAALPVYYSAEAKLNALDKVSRMSAYSFEILKRIKIESLATSRAEAFETFCKNLRMPDIEVLGLANAKKRNSRDIYSPTLKFKDPTRRDEVYAALREKDVFAVIFWGGLGDDISASARAEESSIFTIPLDFRYGVYGAKRLADFLSVGKF